MFDEAELDAALARFDELSRRPAAGKRGKPSRTSAFEITFAARDLECDGGTHCR